jgi:hypothetical protein
MKNKIAFVGNRTRDTSLEAKNFTTKLQMHIILFDKYIV